MQLITVYNPSVEAGDCKYVYLGYDNPSNCTTLTATAFGGSGEFTYLWTPGNKTGATIQVCPTATTTYTATATDSYGCKATDMVKVEVIDVRCGSKKVCHDGMTLCVDKIGIPDHLAHGDKLGTCGTIACGLALRSAESSIESNSQNKTSSGFTLQCFPNPAHDVLTVQLDNITPEGINKRVVQLEILDITGRQVLKQTATLTEGLNTINLDISQLSKGIFIVKMTDSQNQKAWVKMVKE